MHFWLSLAGVCLVFAQYAFAALVNVTVDDKYGDPLTGAPVMYFPPGTWIDATLPCSSCTAHPDSNQTLNETLHTNTFISTDGRNATTLTMPTAAVTFNG